MMYDVAIVGAGPAGMTAALYALRAGCSVIILEKEWVGGQLCEITELHNYPGYDGAGTALADKMMDQISSFPKFELVYDEVLEVKKNQSEQMDNGFELTLMCEQPAKALTVIFATGTAPRKLDEFSGCNNVHYCATCDGPLYQGKSLAVIGGGNTAYSDALYLKGLGNDVAILYRGETPKAEKCLQDQAFNAGIRTITYAPPRGRIEDSRIVELYYTVDNEIGILPVDAVFVAVGREPQSMDLYKHFCERRGVFLAAKGDQVVLACAEGAKAGIEASKLVQQITQELYPKGS